MNFTSLRTIIIIVSLVVMGWSVSPAVAGTILATDFGGNIFVIEAGQKTLVVNVTQFGIPNVVNDLTYNEGNRLIYGIAGGALYGDPDVLFTVDVSAPTPVVKTIGLVEPPSPSTTHSIAGLAFVGRKLYATAWGDGTLFTIDYQLQPKVVLEYPSPVDFNIEDLAAARFAKLTLLFGQQALSFDGNYFFRIMPFKKSVKIIGPVNPDGDPRFDYIYGLAFDPDERIFYGATGWGEGVVFEIDPRTGTAGRVIYSGEHFVGLEVVPDDLIPTQLLQDNAGKEVLHPDEAAAVKLTEAASRETEFGRAPRLLKNSSTIWGWLKKQ